MLVKESWHDCYGDARASAVDNAGDFFIFKPDYVLTVHFQQIVISKQAITSCRWIFDQTHDSTVFESKSNVTKAVFVQRDGSFKRPENAPGI